MWYNIYVIKRDYRKAEIKMKHEEKGMTNKQAKALLKAIEIIIDLSPTKDDAKKRIKEIAKEIEKEPTDTDQGNR
jgi:hypothetical protein